MPEFSPVERHPSLRFEGLRKEIEKGPEIRPRLAFMFPLSNNRLEALEMMRTGKPDIGKIKKLLKSEDWVEKEAGRELLNDLLKSNKEDSTDAKKAVPIGYPEFLETQKPLFATNDTKELVQRISKLEKFSQELKKKYKDRFVGFTVFGSTSKGYFEKESDLEYSLIVKDGTIIKNINKKFEKQFGYLEPCHGLYMYVGKDNKVYRDAEDLFHGLFFGDYRELIKIQKAALEDMDEDDWERIRKLITKHESIIFKAGRRLNIGEQEVERIKKAIPLLRTPPPYDDTLRIIRKRVEKMVKD